MTNAKQVCYKFSLMISFNKFVTSLLHDWQVCSCQMTGIVFGQMTSTFSCQKTRVINKARVQNYFFYHCITSWKELSMMIVIWQVNAKLLTSLQNTFNFEALK